MAAYGVGMEDIVEFLLARIAEDESNLHSWWNTASVPVLDRALAECEAKRRMIDQLQRLDIGHRRPMLLIMAVPYAGHPAYRDEWRL